MQQHVTRTQHMNEVYQIIVGKVVCCKGKPVAELHLVARDKCDKWHVTLQPHRVVAEYALGVAVQKREAAAEVAGGEGRQQRLHRPAPHVSGSR